MVEKGVTGIVIGIWEGEEPLLILERGVGDLDSDRPISQEDHFRIGSVTKSFTVTRILQLSDAGELSLDDPISSYVPDLENGSATLRELANMSAGIFNYTEDPAFPALLFEDISAPWTSEQLVEIAKGNSPYFAPGEGWHYSNTATVLLGMVIENVTENPLGEELQKNILEPLELNSTTYPTTPALPEPYAHGYALFEPDSAPTDISPSSPGSSAGSGAMVSTLGDLHTWGKVLATGSLLSPAMHKAQIELLPNNDCPTCPEYDGYGMGIGNLEGWLGHTGDYLGYQSLVMHDSDTDRTVVILTNFRNFTNHDHLPTQLFRQIVEFWRE